MNNQLHSRRPMPLRPRASFYFASFRRHSAVVTKLSRLESLLSLVLIQDDSSSCLPLRPLSRRRSRMNRFTDDCRHAKRGVTGLLGPAISARGRWGCDSRRLLSVIALRRTFIGESVICRRRKSLSCLFAITFNTLLRRRFSPRHSSSATVYFIVKRHIGLFMTVARIACDDSGQLSKANICWLDFAHPRMAAEHDGLRRRQPLEYRHASILRLIRHQSTMFGISGYRRRAALLLPAFAL